MSLPPQESAPVAKSSTASTGLGQCLDEIRTWLEKYILVSEPLDLDLLALWAAHTYVCEETYSTPRLQIDSSMPGSGKTTVLEHLHRLTHSPVQAASISSPALLARMLKDGPRTLLIDEVDRSLNPKKPGVEELIAIINSGYKRGGTRPVLVQSTDKNWTMEEMPTFAPVAMAGNAPALPDDTRSRCIRVLLMPDFHGETTPSDWEDIEPAAERLGEALAYLMDLYRSEVREARPPLPEGCTGRMREKWKPLKRIAEIAGGHWPATTDDLIRRDMENVQMEREEGLLNLPPAVVLLKDIHAVTPEETRFVSSTHLVDLLIVENPTMWGEASSYGKALTVQRMGRMLVQAFSIRSQKHPDQVRGYYRAAFERAWDRLGVTARTVQDTLQN